MQSKEEILAKHLYNRFDRIDTATFLKAMEEYASQFQSPPPSKDVTQELLTVLKELVELKEIKDTQGKTKDYLNRQPLAWITAKRLIVQNKWHGVKAQWAEQAKENK